eukprot:8166833-Prorocentrum_lima.AAC.1
MTSSLVGSEMCIRDSPSWAEGQWDPLSHLRDDLVEREIAPWTFPMINHCLLYTSDAADDM